MKITSGRGSVIMQQLMAQQANKANTSNNKTKNTGGGSDNDGDSDGGETSRAQRSQEAGGINYKQLAEAVKAGVVRPPSAPRNREGNSGNDDPNDRAVSARQPEPSGQTAGISNVKQAAAANAAPPNRGASGVYTGRAQAELRQSTYAKGDLVNLSA